MKTREIIEAAQRYLRYQVGCGNSLILIQLLAEKVEALESREEVRHRIKPIKEGRKPEVLGAELEALMEKARKLPPPTKREREEQALCWTYGNMALTTNHKPNFGAFQLLARTEFAWTNAQFEEWAKGREWYP